MSTTPRATPVSTPYDKLAAYIRSAEEQQFTATLGEWYEWACGCRFTYTSRGWLQRGVCRKHANSGMEVYE